MRQYLGEGMLIGLAAIRPVRFLVYCTLWLLKNALPHLGLLRLLPDRLPCLPSRSQKQSVDEPLADGRLVLLLRLVVVLLQPAEPRGLVEESVPASALWDVGDRLRHGSLHAEKSKMEEVVADHQPGQQLRFLGIL